MIDNDEDELSVILPEKRELPDESQVATITEKNRVPSPDSDIHMDVRESQTVPLEEANEHLSFLTLSKEVTLTSQVTDVKPVENLTASEVHDTKWDEGKNLSGDFLDKENEQVSFFCVSEEPVIQTSEVAVAKLPVEGGNLSFFRPPEDLVIPTSQVAVSKLPVDFSCVSCQTFMFHV